MTKQERDKLNEHLIWAAESRLVSVMKSLIKAGADLSIQSISGFDSIETLKFTSPAKYKKYSGELIALAEKVRTSRLEKEDMRKKGRDRIRV